MKRSLKILIGVLIVFTVIGISGYIVIQNMNKSLDSLKEIEIETIDLSTIQDGTYEGTYKAFPIEVIVEVTIVNHVITEIDLIKHVSGQGAPGEEVIDLVILDQSLDVDLISGATYSSKVILLAIEDALKN